MTKNLIFSSLLLLIIGVAGWYFMGNTADETVFPTRNTVIQAVYATGEVEPVHWAKISPRIAGQVISVWVDDNDTVKREEILAQLDDTVEGAKLVEYQARLDFLRKEVSRYRKLVRSNAASRQKLENLESEVAEFEAKIDAQAKYILRMQLTAPMDGVILRRDIEPGEVITLDDVIFWVGQLKPLRVTAEVDEEDIALVQRDQKVLIKADAFPDREIEGTVSDITPKGDPVDKDFRIRIALPQATELMIGMTVEVNIITTKEENALTLPLSAVSGDIVWLRDGKRFVERKVKTGLRDDNRVQIISGLSEGDEVLLTAPADGYKS